LQGLNNVIGKTFAAETIKRPSRAVLNDVMQYRDNAFIGRRHAQHHAHWMQHIRGAGFVDLAGMSFSRNGNRAFQRAKFQPFTNRRYAFAALVSRRAAFRRAWVGEKGWLLSRPH
jgi:hypothetical protein